MTTNAEALRSQYVYIPCFDTPALYEVSGVDFYGRVNYVTDNAEEAHQKAREYVLDDLSRVMIEEIGD